MRIAATTVAFAAVVAGTVLLRDSWVVLLTAAPLALVLTQFAFLATTARTARSCHAPRQRVGGPHLRGPADGPVVRLVDGQAHAPPPGPNKLGTDTDIESDVVSFHGEAAAAPQGCCAGATAKQGWWFWPLLTLAG